MTSADVHPAVPALVAALIGDVFYQTILVGHVNDDARHAALAAKFPTSGPHSGLPETGSAPPEGNRRAKVCQRSARA